MPAGHCRRNTVAQRQHPKHLCHAALQQCLPLLHPPFGSYLPCRALLAACPGLTRSWTPAHGGQLRLYPFPRAPLDVAPRADRLLLFASTRLHHRVMPSTAPARCCFTIWLSQTRRWADWVRVEGWGRVCGGQQGQREPGLGRHRS